MEGRRKALYSYSWQQSPINKHRRVNSLDEEKKIFDDWFEEKADEYFPWIRDQGPDDKTMHTNWTFSSPPCSPKICRAFAHASVTIRERIKRPKQNQKTLEEAHKETKRLANITRYEKSLKETRKAIGKSLCEKIKKEKQRKQMFSQSQDQKKLFYSVTLPENSACSSLNEFSSFQKKIFKETAKVECSLSDSKELKGKLKSGSILSKSAIICNKTEERTEQTTSSKSKQQASGYHSDYDSDSELLKLALESSPVQKSNSALRVTLSDDELSDEALLAMLASSPVSNRNSKRISDRLTHDLLDQS